MSNSKLDLHNVNAHIKFGVNPLRFTQVIVLKLKTDVLWADNSSKIYKICPLAIPKQTQYQCTYQVWWKSIDIYWSYHPEMKIQTCCRQITLSKIDKICQLAIPNQIFIISMHIPSLVKIHRYLLKLSSGNGNIEVSGVGNCQELTKFAH